MSGGAAAGDGAGRSAGHAYSPHPLSLGDSRTHRGALSWRSGGWELSPAWSLGLPESHAPTLPHVSRADMVFLLERVQGAQSLRLGAGRGPRDSVK